MCWKNFIWIIACLAILTSWMIYEPGSFLHQESKLSKEFKKYWYDGNAELASYKLYQSRYGELHEGHAVLIFVTEDFSRSKQVKLDKPDLAGKDAVPILKCNFTRKFNTGIYPYSIMTSVYTPTDLTGSLKTSASVQEWCGQAYTQLNKGKDGKWKAQQFSYFESDGDVSTELEAPLLEDEVWNILRIDPSSLPLGETSIIPGSTISRLRHSPLQTMQATISQHKENGQIQTVIQFADRKLDIRQEGAFPYKILGWEEVYSEFGGKEITTRAELMREMRLPYWGLHNNKDLIYRDSLGLSM